MPEQKKHQKPIQAKPELNPEADPADIPQAPLSQEEELDLIPEDDELSETAPYETPEPGEGP